MKTYEAKDYEYGDLVVLVRGKYNKIKIGEIGVIKERWSAIANIEFAKGAGAFPYSQFIPLGALCK